MIVLMPGRLPSSRGCAYVGASAFLIRRSIFSNSSDGFMRGQLSGRCSNDKAAHGLRVVIKMPNEKAVMAERCPTAFAMRP